MSGRSRPVGEMNGKSGNLNSCAAQIYPPGRPVPSNELICIFDADQATPYSTANHTCLSAFLQSLHCCPFCRLHVVMWASKIIVHGSHMMRQSHLILKGCLGVVQVAGKDFFLRCLPLFDGGRDVGMVLSPQAFHNLDGAADVFNHANTHFWEYMQPGYDALNFISCTGTNFLVRSAAFLEVLYFPPLPQLQSMTDVTIM